jgi:hypothetical protein
MMAARVRKRMPQRASCTHLEERSAEHVLSSSGRREGLDGNGTSRAAMGEPGCTETAITPSLATMKAPSVGKVRIGVNKGTDNITSKKAVKI